MLNKRVRALPFSQRGVSEISARCTAVLSKTPHSNCCKRVPNRPLRHLRGRFGTRLEQLECGVFERAAVFGHPCRAACIKSSTCVEVLHEYRFFKLSSSSFAT